MRKHLFSLLILCMVSSPTKRLSILVLQKWASCSSTVRFSRWLKLLCCVIHTSCVPSSANFSKMSPISLQQQYSNTPPRFVSLQCPQVHLCADVRCFFASQLFILITSLAKSTQCYLPQTSLCLNQLKKWTNQHSLQPQNPEFHVVTYTSWSSSNPVTSRGCHCRTFFMVGSKWKSSNGTKEPFVSTKRIGSLS